MKKELRTGIGRKDHFTISHDDDCIIIDYVTEDGKFVHLEANASELLQTVKAHHALTRPKA